MFFFDPLEQFSIELYSIFFSSFNLSSLTSISIMAFLVFSIILFCIYSSNSVFILNKFQKLLRNLFQLVLGLLKDSASIKKYSFVLLLYTTFLFIFISNILGMIPYSMTITSHFILTVFFSLAFFLGNNLIAFSFHKEKYFILFLPDGVPTPLIPLIIIIEYVSYFSKIFSLAIRLFANMMSGHILLKILIGFV